MTHQIVALDHVQLAMPEGGEDAARRFYAGVLGFGEISKPASLASRGGVWFQSGIVQVHLGVEADFRPARKAHPAIAVRGLAELITLCATKGFEVAPDVEFDGRERAHVTDPFGNRIEVIEARA